MELLLMRHADAVKGAGSDFHRVLSDKGRKQAEKMGGTLRIVQAVPTIIASSPLLRAKETASIVAKALGGNLSVRIEERLACGMTINDAMTLVLELGGPHVRLMLVGHAPDLSNLTAYLMGAPERAIDMQKCAVACLNMERGGHAGSVLRWLMTPTATAKKK